MENEKKRARVDHAAESIRWMENANTAQASRVDPKNEELAIAYAGIAHAHATLALVEQQRTANLIALWALPDGPKVRLVEKSGIDEATEGIMLAAIREALEL